MTGKVTLWVDQHSWPAFFSSRVIISFSERKVQFAVKNRAPGKRKSRLWCPPTERRPDCPCPQPPSRLSIMMTTPPDACYYVYLYFRPVITHLGRLRLPGVRAGLAGLADCPAADTGSVPSAQPRSGQRMRGVFGNTWGGLRALHSPCSFSDHTPHTQPRAITRGTGGLKYTALDLTLL